METRSTGSRVCLNGADGPHDNVRKPRSTRSEFVIVKARMWIIEHRDMVENSIQAVARNINKRWTELLQARH